MAAVCGTIKCDSVGGSSFLGLCDLVGGSTGSFGVGFHLSGRAVLASRVSKGKWLLFGSPDQMISENAEVIQIRHQPRRDISQKSIVCSSRRDDSFQ